MNEEEEINQGKKDIKKNNTRMTSTYILNQLRLESIKLEFTNIDTIKEKTKTIETEKGYRLYGDAGGLKTPDLIGTYHRKEVI